MSGPLAGIRVLDLKQAAERAALQRLAATGATRLET